jgi:hypothetical protein
VSPKSVAEGTFQLVAKYFNALDCVQTYGLNRNGLTALEHKGM